MNRDLPPLIVKGGLEITCDERMYIPSPRVLFYDDWGRASAER